MEHVPQNHWYVVAIAEEITDRPISRSVLGNPIVLYRLANGEVVALRDRCSHRRYPLSLGNLVGDNLVCGYHGFSYDCTGRCVAVPGQDKIPSRADVVKYPTIQQGRWVWIWISDDSPAGVEPPATPWLEDGDAWTIATGMATLDCRYELLVDNLLDLSHETYLHGGYIGTPEISKVPVAVRIDHQRSVVSVDRHMYSVECPSFYARATGLSSPIDRWQDIEFFAPSFYVLHVRVAPAGLPEGEEGEFSVKILYGLTPSSESQTHDFWAVCRNFALEDEGVTAFMDAMQRTIVQQDVDALNILEKRIALDDDSFEVGIGIDRGAIAARRMIQRLVSNEELSTVGNLNRASDPIETGMDRHEVARLGGH